MDLKTAIGVQLVLSINELFPLSPNLVEIDGAKETVVDYQQWEQSELEKIAKTFGTHWNLEGKDVLDVGCGLGGKVLPYLEAGARSVTGLDLRSHSLQSAKTLVTTAHKTDDSVRFLLADAAAVPCPDNSFDVIISINVLEHVDNLYAVLRECNRLLRPGGVMLLHFPPFYSAWGAHLEGWINFPWPHLFFSDKVLIKAASMIEQRKRQNRHYIPTAQVQWERLQRLPELNRVTAYQFIHLINALNLDVRSMEMLPFGYHYFSRTFGPLRHLRKWLFWLTAPARIPRSDYNQNELCVGLPPA